MLFKRVSVLVGAVTMMLTIVALLMDGQPVSGKPGSGATRRRGSTRRSNPPRQPGDAEAGTGVEECRSEHHRTGQPKGPCDSYSRGPFTYFWPRGLSLRRPPRPSFGPG